MYSYGRGPKKNGKEKEALALKQNDIGHSASLCQGKTSAPNHDILLYTATGTDRPDRMNAESRTETPVFQRSVEEKTASPDRLNLDRRRLTMCPRLEGEEQLRLLNFQHNYITRLDNLSNLKKLIFLDLYDNQIQRIQGLDALVSLRVLMLGKNRISRIENLDGLIKLDVLDLHGNQISKIEKLNHLEELRVLNLAGNLLRNVNNLRGMHSLTELNLRRNNVQILTEADTLRNLQRLYLSYNDISSFDDISCIAAVPELSDLSLDGNPITQDPYYKRNILKNVPRITQLDTRKVTDDERRLAVAMVKKEEGKMQEYQRVQAIREKRQQAISNVKRQWQYLQVGLMSKSNHVNPHMGMPEMAATHVSSVQCESRTSTPLSSQQNSRPGSRTHSHLGSRPGSARSQLSETRMRSYTPPTNQYTSQALADKRSSHGDGMDEVVPDHLCEQDGERLLLYGSGALEGLDRSWSVQATGAVTTIVFQFIDFDDLVRHLHKIRVRFPNVHTLHMLSTNVRSLQQLSGLSVIRRLDHLTLGKDGNPITTSLLWRSYLIFRLAHFSLKTINEKEVSDSDIVTAEKLFGPLSSSFTSQLPMYRLTALYNEGKKRQLLSDDRKKPMITEGKLTDRGAESLGRAALVYRPEPPQVDRTRQDFVHNYVKDMAHCAIDTYNKQARLQQLWPQILAEMVHSALCDMSDTQAYAKKSMQELEKSIAST